ncbi:MAG: PfaD family polyunsaturated fatty acid/polyketide biosynthesis protein [Paludisphaera borealis]|uniref:PfaD family polyunsaturated fatty acid/polyketide biosynthesis protein n=1 Tax=Paludisphaera borealis TaxID=1387353 RepID=UPI0028465BE3|nr:PfaD family polyunsaturated fatty acid/polyketide biosynthesis protein [Paludisphaera borealis]MDR3618551.1 PfaD family polyunsaturated fatty acid/polyketide biosynthesis protein [Paludisphaera borealis]
MQLDVTECSRWEDALGQVGRGLWTAVDGDGSVRFDPAPAPSGRSRSAFIPPCPLEELGEPSFRSTHGIRYACVAGAMANGIASVELVEAMSRAGMLGIFGAAGLALEVVDAAVQRVQSSLGNKAPYGFNLIHSPQDAALESAVVDLYLRRGVRLVEASAFLDLTLPVVRYRVAGVHRDEQGRVVAPNRIIAKASRVEVARKFLSPPPERYLRTLVEQGTITADQAAMAATIPMAEDLTAEADSGGHTDNQPLVVLLPTMIALRDRLAAEHRYDRPLRIGAAGGISTPWAAAGALAMGASYLVTGSVNQSCVEAGTSESVRALLAQAQQADVAMAPAADMFEMGVKVQVLKRGTMFAMRGAKLYEYYRAYNSLEQIPEADRQSLEKTILRAPVAEVWDQTRAFFARRDPAQIVRAEADPKHKMALVFRWYLGQSSNWANVGEPTRTLDYQIWCGPAMAAFNDWVRGSFLERPENRRAATVSLNILYGAAVLLRARFAAFQGVAPPSGVPRLTPLQREEIENRNVGP